MEHTKENIIKVIEAKIKSLQYVIDRYYSHAKGDMDMVLKTHYELLALKEVYDIMTQKRYFNAMVKIYKVGNKDEN